MNQKYDTDKTSFETVTIFCKKGKTITTNLSFEKNQSLKINVSLVETKTINMNDYVGLLNDNIISIEKTNKSDFEQYFTRRKHVDAMINNMKRDFTPDKAFEPCAGTGGFIKIYLKYMGKKNNFDLNEEPDKKRYRKE